MATLEAKEKDLRTIVTDGFARMDSEFKSVRKEMRERFAEHEEQIDTLAVSLNNMHEEMNQRFGRLETRVDSLEEKFDKMNWKLNHVSAKIDAMDPKLDRILAALAL